MVWTDKDGRILDILNATHPEPDTLINTYIQDLFVDGHRFHITCKQVLETGRTMEFTFLVDFRGTPELRRCRIMPSGDGGLLVINYEFQHVC